MAIDYGLPELRSNVKFQSDALHSIQALQEDYQAGHGINILSEDGLTQVLSDAVTFNDYSTRLAEGADETTVQAIATLGENTRRSILQESMISGINPITALSLPMLRVTYPKIAVREGLPTEPVEAPSFKVMTKRPYIVDTKTKEKLYLPKALRSNGELFSLPKLSDAEITLTDGHIQDHDLLKPVAKNWQEGDAIDVDFRISEVTVDGVKFNVDFQLNPNLNVIKGSIEKDGKRTDIVATVDRHKGLLTVMSVGEKKATAIKVVGYVSSEMNNATTQVGFDITGEEINIPTGHPIESPINIQQMTDVMSMYRVDATMAHLETMSTVLAQSIDLKGVEHIERVFQKDPTVTETFNVKPPANFMMGEAEWREQIKITFDRIIVELQDRTHIYAGHAVVFAHPLDAMVLSNIRWTYQAETQANAVAVDYKVGTFTSGVTTYVLLQSPHFQRGKMKVVYVPAENDLQTTKYFPYSFNTIRGAASPNTPNVPSIQMIQRSVFHTFTPMVAEVRLTNFDLQGKQVKDLASHAPTAVPAAGAANP